MRVRERLKFISKDWLRLHPNACYSLTVDTHHLGQQLKSRLFINYQSLRLNAWGGLIWRTPHTWDSPLPYQYHTQNHEVGWYHTGSVSFLLLHSQVSVIRNWHLSASLSIFHLSPQFEILGGGCTLLFITLASHSPYRFLHLASA